ncbi:MAG: hypothetical protein NC418_08520 [Muribaculaceae bacterium]|nr:hypothetical protein [Muribaculaceae bacterium]
MKTISTAIFFALIAMMICTTFTSCSQDDDLGTPTSVIGDWVGISYYNNPVGGTKKQELYMQFNADNSGSLEFRGSTQTAFAYFTYRESKNIISCKGAYASTSGNSDSDFEMDLKHEGDRLYPLSKYPQFILTQDGSVMTDSNGNEIANNESYLHGVWIREGGLNIIYFYNDGKTYEEFILDAPGSSSYTSHSTGNYNYHPIAKTLQIGTSLYSINSLTASTMVLQNKATGNVYKYTKGRSSDLPKVDDIRNILVNGYVWSTGSGKGSVVYWFNEDGRCIRHGISTSKFNGDYGIMSAQGSFSVNAGKVSAKFTDISFKPSAAAADFPKWKDVSSRTETFTVTILDFANYKKIRITFDDNSSMTLTAF